MLHTLIALALTTLAASSSVPASRPEAASQMRANPVAQSPARTSAKPVVTGTIIMVIVLGALMAFIAYGRWVLHPIV